MNNEEKSVLKTAPTLKITLLFLLSTHGLAQLVTLLTPDAFIIGLSNGDPTVLEDEGIIYLFLGVLTTVFGWLMHYGYHAWVYKLLQNQSPTASTLLEGFERTGKIIGFTLQKACCTLFWIFAFSFATSLLFMPVMMFSFLTPLLFCIPILFLLAVFWIYTRYITAAFHLITHPEESSTLALHESAQIQPKAHKSLVQAHIQFLPWTILYLGLEQAIIFMTANPLSYLLLAFQWLILLKCYPEYYLALAVIYKNHQT